MKINQKSVLFLVFIMMFVAGCTPMPNSVGTTSSTDLNDNPDKVTVYFFWGDGCPHCAAEKPFLEDLQTKYPDVEIKMFETWKTPENAKIFQEVAMAYGTSAKGVPTTFIGDDYWVGYAEYMGQEMETKIQYCLENDCINPGDLLNN